mmetsp:Transcript_14309/g.34769  ORF Transcript_14309/g.34769 Transcript_14309/m.34769 type:complete len:690 (-) Transcript_14309:4721-6790(-)
MQAEDLGRLLRRKLLDGSTELGDLRGVRHNVPRVQRQPLGKGAFIEVLGGVRVHEQLVEGVGDAPAVLNGGDHVRHRSPRRGGELLGVHLHEVVLQKLHACTEVRLVELVADVPAQGPELAALLDDGVHVTHHKEHLAPLVARHRIQHVLAHPGVRVAQACAHPHGGLVGELDGHLKQADGEQRVRLCGDPQPEVLVQLFGLGEEVFNLGQVRQPQVGILQQHPLALGGCRGQVLARDDLLTLAHGHSHHLDLLALGKLLDELGGVGARRQEADDGDKRGGLRPGVFHVERDGLNEAPPDRLGDVLLRRHHGAVLAQRLDDAHLFELGDFILEVRHIGLLGRLEVVPLAPQPFVARQRVKEVVECWDLRQRHQVQPALVWDPLLGLLAHCVDVQRAATLKEHAHQVQGESLGRDEDLVGEHEGERHLVALEEAALDVQVDGVRHVLDDVVDALGGHRRLLCLVDGELVQVVELLQGRLVHDVARGELGDEEVHERGAVRHRAVLLTRLGDLEVGLRCVGQLLIDVLRRLLGAVEDVDELHVVQKVTRRVGQPEQQVVLELLDLLLVARHFLYQRLPLLLQLVLLFKNELAQQLVLQPPGGDGEVDHRHLGRHLGRVVRVGQAGGAKQAERVGEINLLVQLDDHVFPLFHDALLQHRVEHGIQFLLDVLDEHGLAVGQAVLEVISELLLA